MPLRPQSPIRLDRARVSRLDGSVADGQERERMRVGFHIPDFTWQGGPADLRVRLAEVARLAEQGGFDRISVIDHVWFRLASVASVCRHLPLRSGTGRRAARSGHDAGDARSAAERVPRPFPGGVPRCSAASAGLVGGLARPRAHREECDRDADGARDSQQLRGPLDFELPPIVASTLPWRRIVDTALDPPDDITDLAAAPPVRGDTHRAGGHSMVLLSADLKHVTDPQRAGHPATARRQ
jgi:hypothetical protein